MDMPQPTAAHQQLERFVGSWIGTETIHPTPFDTKGGTATGRVRNVRALGGFAVVQDYEQERGGRVNFSGHGVLRFELSTNKVEMHWFDSIGQPPGVFEGTWTGDKLTVVQQGAQGQVRASWDFGVPGQYTYAMEVSGDGTHWMRFMDATYTKEG